MSRGTLDPALLTRLSLTGLSPSLAGFPKTIPLSFPVTSAVHNPSMHARWFRLLPFRSPLLTESHVVFSSSGYLDVSVHRVPFHTLWIGVWIPGVYPGGFPHSDTCGSQDICSYPQLFAAYHVLHRLLVPRHPPCALSCLTFPVLIAFKTGGSLAVSFHRVYNVMSSYCFDSLSLKDNSSDVSFSYL